MRLCDRCGAETKNSIGDNFEYKSKFTSQNGYKHILNVNIRLDAMAFDICRDCIAHLIFLSVRQ
jgi:hypothetical protein